MTGVFIDFDVRLHRQTVPPCPPPPGHFLGQPSVRLFSFVLPDLEGAASEQRVYIHEPDRPSRYKIKQLRLITIHLLSK
jgi:hypothetical protein